MAEAVMPLLARDPSMIGPYSLAGRLGAGGMGVVYLAWRDGKPVAVKVMRDELAGDRQFRVRFAREVQVLRRIGGICTASVVDADPDADPPYLVTEYVPGPSLSSYVAEEGPLPARELLALATGLAEALRSIHAAGIVHRDLKPSNVLLSPSGPRVSDFGIAQIADATSLTQSSTSLGSPGYISPEQIRGASNGPAADVFTWAATVVYAATGRPPFGVGAMDAVLYRVLHEQPDMAGWEHPHLTPLVRAALEKEPANRPSPGDIMSALLPSDLTRQLSDEDATVRLLEQTWQLSAAVTARLPAPPAASVSEEDAKGSWRWRRYLFAAVAGVAVGGASLAALPPADDDALGATQLSVATRSTAAATPKGDPTKAPVAAAVGLPLRERDWSSVRYDVDCGGEGVAGTDRQFSDLDGDGLDEALVRIDCNETTQGSNFAPATYLLVFAGDSPAQSLRLLDVLGDEEGEGVGTASLADSVLTITERAYSSTDVPRCCPDTTQISRYALQNGRLALLSRE